MNATPTILTLNIGSSSVKFALFRREANVETRIAGGAVEGIGAERGRFRLRFRDKEPEEQTARFKDHEAALQGVFETLSSAEFDAPSAIGHRVVHGGVQHQRHTVVDAPVLAALRCAIPFAPLHLPAEIRGIEAAMGLYPYAVQIACFDTSFHRELPELSRRLPLPRRFYDGGIRRYGFHGLSYEYIVDKLGAALGRRSIIAHLGSGASMVALDDGKPIETTMGLTPAGGFMSATRSGDLDPGVLLYLARAGHSPDDIEHIVNHESGWLGVSGKAFDMKALEAQRGSDERAALAFEMFCYQARKSLGALVAALGGIDTLVFTGGIGEGSGAVRARICDPLACFGLQLDEAANAVAKDVISATSTPCQVRVVATDEEIMIARHARRQLDRRGDSSDGAYPTPQADT